MLGRNAVGFLGEGADQVDAAPRNDESLELVFPEVVEQLHLRRVCAFVEKTPELRVLRLSEPGACDPVELLRRHAGVRRRKELHHALFPERLERLMVAREERLEGLPLAKRQIL